MVLRLTFLGTAALLVCAPGLRAQTVTAATSAPAAKPQDGFVPGWTLGMRFEGSSSADGSIYDLGGAVGYNFSRHLGVDLGIPYYFVSTPTSIKGQDPNAVSGDGIGSAFTDIKLNFPGKVLNYDSTVHLTAPTGDVNKGLSTGHATWNWTNHVEHGWGNFTPYFDAGLGNTVLDTQFFHRPFITFGYNAQFEAGTEFDVGKLSFTASAYDIAPWGPQTVISRVFRCSARIKCAAAGRATNRRGYTSASVLSGGWCAIMDSIPELISSRCRSLTWNWTTAAACRCN